LIRELRRCSRTYREIAKILQEHLGLQVNHTTICDFVRIRSRRPAARSQVGQLPPKQPVGDETPFVPDELSNVSPRSTGREEAVEVCARIEKLKRGTSVPSAGSSDAVFHYDEGAPLRLLPETDKNRRRGPQARGGSDRLCCFLLVDMQKYRHNAKWQPAELMSES
jgi:hypothetical protein